MCRQTEISPSSPFGASRIGSTDTSRVPPGSKDESLEEWRAQADAYAVHATAKRPFLPRRWNSKLTTLLLAAAVAMTFVLFRCYRQLAIVNSPVKGPLRSLAEGEVSGGATPCVGADLEGNQPVARADAITDDEMLQRIEGVVQQLIHVTKNCASADVLLPLPFNKNVIYLFLGLCIQGVAALSSLLGRHFDVKKKEVLKSAVDAAIYVMEDIRKREGGKDPWHALRLVLYANSLSDLELETPPLVNEKRLQMLEQLLKLQSKALELIDSAVSSFLKSQHPVTTEVINKLTEELRRVIYIRRDQVFSNTHLCHYLEHLKDTEKILLRFKSAERLERAAKQTFEEKLEYLINGEEWVKKPVELTQRTLNEASFQEKRYPEKQHKPHSMQSAPTTDRQVSKTRSGRNQRKPKIPPPLQGISGIFGVQRRTERTQMSLMGTGTSHSEHTRQTPDRPSPSYEAKTSQAAHMLQQQATVPVLPPDQPLTELGTTWAQISLGPPSSGPGASFSLAAWPQPDAPAAEETFETWAIRQAEERPTVDEETPWSPWSSTWPFRWSLAANEADAAETASSYQPNQQRGHAATPPSGVINPAGSLHSSLSFTAPDVIASAGANTLESLKSNAPPAEMQGMAQSHSGSAFDALSPSLPSPLAKERTFWLAGSFSSSEPESTLEGFHSTGQGMAEGGERRHGISESPLAVSSLLELLEQEANEEA